MNARERLLSHIADFTSPDFVRDVADEIEAVETEAVVADRAELRKAVKGLSPDWDLIPELVAVLALLDTPALAQPPGEPDLTLA